MQKGVPETFAFKCTCTLDNQQEAVVTVTYVLLLEKYRISYQTSDFIIKPVGQHINNHHNCTISKMGNVIFIAYIVYKIM